MNHNFPVFTTDNECQDCYKCVRHCHCKAIRIVNARAAVIPELCVCCGTCVKVCPAHAKKIRSDLSRLRFLLENKEVLYASVAPSFVGYFKGISINRLAGALRKLGFAGVSETALGAELVSAETGRIVRESDRRLFISSACPASVDYIRKYAPEYTDCIVPVVSPVMAHAKLLKQIYGDHIKVVFFGPCAAKKNEADRSPDVLALAVTFESLRSLLEEKEIRFDAVEDAPLAPKAAEEGRAYSLEGGMNDTLRGNDPDIRYVAVSGLANIGRLLSGSAPLNAHGGKKIFIECLACHGGCVNGPMMPEDGSDLETLMHTMDIAASASSLGRAKEVEMEEKPDRDVPARKTPTEAEIVAALETVGKHSPADELNCGGCGYNSCREFAAAMIDGKAETSMCLSYLRTISQKTSNALIKYIPASVVIVDNNLQIIECNRHFAKMCGEDALAAYDSCGNLTGADLRSLIEFSDLFESAFAGGSGDLERFNQIYGDRIFNISVFSITAGRTVGAVIQDVTQSELHREKVAEKAREVIRKNVTTVQKIAQYLGEHMAETEIILREVAGSYSEIKDKKDGDGK